MDNLQYSRPIDVHRISEYPEVQRVIAFLLSHLKEAGLIKGSPRDCLNTLGKTTPPTPFK